MKITYGKWIKGYRCENCGHLSRYFCNIEVCAKCGHEHSLRKWVNDEYTTVMRPVFEKRWWSTKRIGYETKEG